MKNDRRQLNGQWRLPLDAFWWGGATDERGSRVRSPHRVAKTYHYFPLRGFAVAMLVVAAITAQAQSNSVSTITVAVNQRGARVSPELYGIFFEEINHAGEGGLYAELVRNRDFEANTIPEGWRLEGQDVFTPHGARVRKWFTNDLPGWSLVSEGNAEGEIAQESAAPLNERNPHSLRLTVKTPGTRCGVANEGFWGMNIQAGEWYDLTFHARTAPRENNRGYGLMVSLESRDGKEVCARATIPEVGGAWKKYTLPLHARATDPNARLVITMDEPGDLWFDTVSLFPRKTFKDRPNGMRPDLARMLADLRPGFLRFPGGCVVEGITVQNRIRWKDSIGDISQRKGDFDVWGYYNTYGLGFHEYLQLAEDLNAEPLYVINVGMSCQARTRQPAEVASEAGLKDSVQETLDALEYALGPANSTWGAQRAANGHPEPFKLQSVEIGKENWGTNYLRHYQAHYDAIKARYPQVVTIADAPPRNQPLPQPIEIIDDHFYRDPAAFFRMANHYDNAARDSHKIYVGEYAVNRGVRRGNLFGALSEAVFMLNLEKNSDVVKMASYAPLFENVNRRDWQVNLILLDSSRTVGRSSYQVQKMFSAHRPDVILPTRVDAPEFPLNQGNQTNQAGIRQFYALAGLDEKRREVILKVVNPTATNATATVSLAGAARLGAKAKVITLSHADATSENSLDQPERVVPVESEFNLPGTSFPCNFAPNSLTILRLPLTGS